jgi:hypothetical protein
MNVKSPLLWIGLAALTIAACSTQEPEKAPRALTAALDAKAPARHRSPGKPRAPVLVTLDRNSGFEPTETVQIDVSLLSSAPLQGLEATFRAGDGLRLHAGEHFSHTGSVPSGERLAHSIAVSAASEGRYELSVVVMADLGTRQVGRAFSIPITFGEPAATSKASMVTPLAKPEADGERVKSLRAVMRSR